MIMLLIFCVVGWIGGSHEQARQVGTAAPEFHEVPALLPTVTPCAVRRVSLESSTRRVQNLTIPFAQRRANLEASPCR